MQTSRSFAKSLLITLIVLSSMPRPTTADDLGEVSEIQTQVSDLTDEGRYSEAEPLARKALAMAERLTVKRPLIVADCLMDMVAIVGPLGRHQEIITLQKRALEIYEKELGPDDVKVANGFLNLGNGHMSLAHYDEAEACFKRALSIRLEKPGDPEVAQVLINLGNLYRSRGRYTEAEDAYNRSLKSDEKHFGEQNVRMAICSASLAQLFNEQGRYVEAEQLCNRALKNIEKILGPDHPRVAFVLFVLARIHSIQGHDDQAEPLFRRALSVRERALGEQFEGNAVILINLAYLLIDARRYDEAEPLARRALTINENAFGDEHPSVADSRKLLAEIYAFRKQYSEAEQFYNRSLAIKAKVFGDQHEELLFTLTGLANLYANTDRTIEAEATYKRALQIAETSFSEHHPKVAWCLHRLSYFYHERGREREAEELIDRAISIEDRIATSPQIRFSSYFLRSRISWKLGRKNEALLTLRQAFDLAEQVRQQASGADVERAQSFAQFSDAFEQMVTWQSELGDTSEALQAVERGRARSLLDEMNHVGVDLNLGRSSADRQAIQKKEAQLKTRVAQFEKQLELAPEADKEKLDLALIQARKELYEQYRDERSNSPVYRSLLSAGSGPPTSGQLQRTLLANDRLALVYLFGEEAGYVIVLESPQAEIISLTLDQTQAAIFGTSAGPLTHERLQEILVGNDNSGIVPQLSTPPTETKPESLKRLSARLAALWQLLIPEAKQDALANGKYKHLIVIPDGPLALFPFESLVVQGDQEPEYLLDRGPAIHYGPSLTVLYNLSTRKAVQANKRVLTVADPLYPRESALPSPHGSTLLTQSSGTRYSRIGGQLNRLPFTAEESNVVKDVFSKVGLGTSSLMREQATEANVRQNVAGRKIIHLACHGLTDQAHGNFFGALALTPGQRAQTDSNDDGFLMLPEIYELDVKGCELAILSACQTNYGPQQKGEGVWALSRAFLVSGAKRVVATNWLVNDEAGARLIQYYCTALADDEKQSRPADYARQLQAAKKWVRGQTTWKHPYFWSTFVLVGPN